MSGMFFMLCLLVCACNVFSREKGSMQLKMYQMHNYADCHPPNVYCVFDFKLIGANSTRSSLNFDRSTVNRMYCVPNDDSAATYGLHLITEEQNDGNWSGNVKIRSIQCEQNWSFPYFNTFSLFCSLAYLGLTIWATTSSTGGAFSLRQNIPKLWADNPNPDYERLKAIQGIRVFNTSLVVFWHTVVSLCRCYVEDVEELEKNFNQPIISYFVFMGGFSVQIFFLISTFLLTNQVYELHAKHGHLSLRHCAILLLNRWCRFCLGLFQCTPGLWYVSVDTAYYVMALLVLFVLLQFELKALRVLVFLAVCSVVLFGGYLYWFQLKFMYQPYPEDLKYMVESTNMNLVYSPPIASWTSSLLGVILGYLYYNHKRQPANLSQKWQVLVWVCFVTMPLAVLHFSMYSYEAFKGAFVGALIKPLFVFPLGVGILAFAFNFGGFIKKFLEVKPLLVASNVTYCTYLFHFYIVFAKGLLTKELIRYKAHHLYLWLLFDIAMAFGLGALVTVLVEYPWLTLQKRYVPQIWSLPKKKN